MNRSRSTVVKHKRQAGPAADAPARAATGRVTEDDYEAIEQAVLATARGRWFLSEYLRRHQNEETRRLVRALRRLARVGAAGEAMQHRAALESLRLLLAHGADELARLAGEAAEPTLPEAAAGRLALLLEQCAERGDARQVMAALPVLRDTFLQMARLLGEARAQATPAENVAQDEVEAEALAEKPATAAGTTATLAPEQARPSSKRPMKEEATGAPREHCADEKSAAAAPARRVSIAETKESRQESAPRTQQDNARAATPSPTGQPARKGAPASSAATASEQSARRGHGGGRIIIRRKEDSRTLDIPLPERPQRPASGNGNGAGATRPAGTVRIRARKQA